MKLASVIGLLMAVAALAALILQRSLFAVGVIAVTVQVLAALLMVWARLTFRLRSFHAAANPTEGGLVTSGPYRFLRHPIYAAVLYFTWAGVLTHPSVNSVAIGILASAGLAIRMVAEERLVTERYPEYAAYAASTKRIIPFVF